MLNWSHFRAFENIVVSKLENVLEFPKFNVGLKGENLESVANRTKGCSKTRWHSLHNKEIHVVVVASQSLLEQGNSLYTAHISSVKSYVSTHGYVMHLADPDLITQKCGRLPHEARARAFTSAKAVVIMYKLREIAHHYSCHAKWMLVLDADVFVVDRNRTLQSFIFLANSLKRSNAEYPCELIAQDGPTTLNTGVLFFRISDMSERIVHLWMKLQYEYVGKRNQRWQEDQGWLQYALIRSVKEIKNVSLPFDCGAFDLNRNKNMRINTVRNLCYPRALYYMGLFPGSRSVGPFCLLPGLTEMDRINLHDQTLRPVWRQGQLVYRCEHTDRPDIACDLYGTFLYHGKDLELIENITTYFDSYHDKQSQYPCTTGKRIASSQTPTNTELLTSALAAGKKTTDPSSCSNTILSHFWKAVLNSGWVPDVWRRRRRKVGNLTAVSDYFTF